MFKDRDLNAWRIFVAVAETGAVSRAADRLSLDPAFVSRTLRQLEEDLGSVKLFDRASRPLRLTDNGEAVLDSARELLCVHQGLLDSVEQDPQAMRGTIRVAFPPSLLQTYLVPFLSGFMREYPEVYLSVSEYKSLPPVTFDSPEGRLDVICGFGEDTVHQNIVQIHYGHAPMIPCASPIYLNKNGVPQRPEELEAHVGISLRTPMRPAIEFLCRGNETRPLKWRREIHFDSSAPAQNAAIFGTGIHPGIPALNAWQDLQKGLLVPVLPGWAPPQGELYIYARSEAVRQRRTRVFLEAYREFIDKLHADCERALEAIAGPMKICL